MSPPFAVLHGVEEALYPAVRLPGSLSSAPTQNFTALPPGRRALRGGQGPVGGALRTRLRPLARLGSTTGAWTTDMFIEAVYRSLQNKK